MLRFALLPLLGFCLLAQSETPSPEMLKAEEELARTQKLVDAKVLPRIELDKAKAGVEEARDQATLRATLYGKIGVEDLSPEQSQTMVDAAQRSWDRRQQKLEAAGKLVEVGALPRSALEPLQAEVERGREIHTLAVSRANLLRELSDMAFAEQELAGHTEDAPQTAAPMVERYDGNGVFNSAHYKQTVLAFEHEFGKPLPVSAKGETALHRSMGYDHRDRIDVAVSPDSKEGQWLRQFLQGMQVPYYAFRGFVAGRSTAAHMHLGPPSLPIRKAD